MNHCGNLFPITLRIIRKTVKVDHHDTVIFLQLNEAQNVTLRNQNELKAPVDFRPNLNIVQKQGVYVLTYYWTVVPFELLKIKQQQVMKLS